MSNNLSLKVIPAHKYFQLLEINLKGNGLIEPSDLKKLKIPRKLDYTKGVILYGKAPVWLFAYLSHELHIAKWVATFDPRIGAIIVQSHDINSPHKGDIIPPNKIVKYLTAVKEVKKKKSSCQKLNTKIICIAGPANSGKSVFIRELKNELNKKLKNKYRKDCYIIRACPDGEGDWFGDINPKEGKLYRVKKVFDVEFISKIISDLRGIKNSKKVVFVDCGGKIDKKNQMIFNECTHSIIVSNNKDKAIEWAGALKASELEISAIIYSKDYDVSKKIGEREFEIGRLFRDNKKVIIPANIIRLIK